MFSLFKRTRAACKPVVVVTGKIKYNKETNNFEFWPNYAKGNELKNCYNIGSFPKNPTKFRNITCIGVIDLQSNKIITFNNGVDGIILNIEK